MQTVVPGQDYLTDYASWFHIQNGGASDPDRFDDGTELVSIDVALTVDGDPL